MLEKISETKSFQEYIEKYAKLPKEEKEKIIQRGNRTKPMVYIILPVANKIWKDYYSKNSYCLMGEEDKKILVGLVMLKEKFDERSMPLGARGMNQDELYQYQNWCESTSNYPRPFTKVSVK